MARAARTAIEAGVDLKVVVMVLGIARGKIHGSSQI
jgi:hypothetical protein